MQTLVRRCTPVWGTCSRYGGYRAVPQVTMPCTAPAITDNPVGRRKFASESTKTHTKAQKKTLAALRGLLRHARMYFDNKPPSASGEHANDVSLWTDYIMQQARENQHLNDRQETRRLRRKTQDILTLYEAIVEQKKLLSQHGQIDIDSQEYREAAAQRVGVKIPDRLPLREVDHVSKYDLANKVNKMKGIAGMKAQLYGINEINVRTRQGKQSAHQDNDTHSGDTSASHT
eukprot:gb/GECG01006529.1/.p1 GENE.gb/GECG01006529.1/~~gb/GECG01006529.1/.p1  ORF type:complete len:231 (+),score=19.43 gb/GECG01006529.1/:1-693(+)